VFYTNFKVNDIKHKIDIDGLDRLSVCTDWLEFRWAAFTNLITYIILPYFIAVDPEDRFMERFPPSYVFVSCFQTP